LPANGDEVTLSEIVVHHRPGAWKRHSLQIRSIEAAGCATVILFACGSSDGGHRSKRTKKIAQINSGLESEVLLRRLTRFLH